MIDMIWKWMMKTGMPIVFVYHAFTGNVFLNTSHSEAQGLEKASNLALAPFQYLFAGKEIYKNSEGEYELRQRFDYDDTYFWLKTVGATFSLSPTLACGVAIKGISYFTPSAKEHRSQVLSLINSTLVRSNDAYYRSIGIDTSPFREGEWVAPPTHARRPGDENHMSGDKKALADIVQALQDANILFWADCGTCLGAYRYGGIIPWDNDVDIQIFSRDFENARRALNKLDPSKYQVEDWSGRDKPATYLKVYAKESKILIDIYNADIDEKSKTVSTILSIENGVFYAKDWINRERKYSVSIPFSTIFPLKKANFDGIVIPVPNDTKKFLQYKYGDNLDPVKVYNSDTNKYEKDLSHPYWEIEYSSGS